MFKVHDDVEGIFSRTRWHQMTELVIVFDVRVYLLFCDVSYSLGCQKYLTRWKDDLGVCILF